MKLIDELSPGQLLAEVMWPKLVNLTNEERKVFFDVLTGEWCMSCGCVHPGYPCDCYEVY